MHTHENYILPFLWVHGEDETVYRKMIGVIYDANIRAFCVEARPHNGFCRDSWWHDMDIILDEAEKRGMKVWILDDKHFPTGYANGAALAASSPDLRRQGILHKSFHVRNGHIRLDLSKQAHPSLIKPYMYYVTDVYNGNLASSCRFDDDHWFGVSAIRKDQQAVPVNLNPLVKNNVLEWEAPEGNWEVHLCYLSRNIGTHRSYINMMDASSCRLQLDAVYEPHYQHYRDKFGTVIAGFFSDEPELGNNYMYKMYNILGTDQDLPWSRELEARLRDRLGQDMPALLSLLWSNDCDSRLTASVRYTFMDCVSRLTEMDFSRQIGCWCRQHGVEYIGHVVEDNNQHARTGTSLGHYFRGLKWQSMAGIDDIGGQVEPQGEDRATRSVFGFVNDGEFYHYALGKLGASLAAITPHMAGRSFCEIFGNYGWQEGVRLEKYLLDHFMVRGINHFVPHAFTCSPYPEKDCPPHFYAQGNNPQYRHFGVLMQYANRVCQMISDGIEDVPVAILYHAEAEWCGQYMLMQKPARLLLDNQINYHFIPADVFDEPDFYHTKIGDTLTINRNSYRILLIPYAQFIPASVASAIAEFACHGGKVLFLEAYPEGLCTGEPLPEQVKASAHVIRLEDLLTEVSDMRTVTLTPPNDRIRVMHYRGSQEFYYLFHEGTSTYHGTVDLPVNTPCYLYDPWLNKSFPWEGKDIILEPSHSLFIISGALPTPAEPAPARREKISLTHFHQSVCRAIDYPNFQREREIHTLESYALTDKHFSGIIRYETDYFGKAHTLEITDAYEGVEVFVNGQSAGIQIVPPFSFDLRNLSQDGQNLLTIEVATTLERERGQIKKASPTGITGDVFLYS